MLLVNSGINIEYNSGIKDIFLLFICKIPRLKNWELEHDKHIYIF